MSKSKHDEWVIRLPAFPSSEKPALVIRNGEDITNKVQDITVNGNRGATTVSVTFIKAEVNMEVEEEGQDTLP